MPKAYINASAVLDKRQMKELGWRFFHGTVSEFKELRDKILEEDGSIKEKYQGMEGYANFARDYYLDDMLKAYINVSAVLDKRPMKELAWQQFQGTVSEFKELRDKILEVDGSIKEKYQGMNGCANFARDYYLDDMQKAYKNVSAVLGGVHMLRELDLGWKIFHGTVSQFESLKDLFKSHSLEELQGRQGQERTAQIFQGDRVKAYLNVSALRAELLGVWGVSFKDLNWTKSQR